MNMNKIQENKKFEKKKQEIFNKLKLMRKLNSVSKGNIEAFEVWNMDRDILANTTKLLSREWADIISYLFMEYTDYYVYKIIPNRLRNGIYGQTLYIFPKGYVPENFEFLSHSYRTLNIKFKMIRGNIDFENPTVSALKFDSSGRSINKMKLSELVKYINLNKIGAEQFGRENRYEYNKIIDIYECNKNILMKRILENQTEIETNLNKVNVHLKPQSSGFVPDDGYHKIITVTRKFNFKPNVTIELCLIYEKFYNDKIDTSETPYPTHFCIVDERINLGNIPIKYIKHINTIIGYYINFYNYLLKKLPISINGWRGIYLDSKLENYNKIKEIILSFNLYSSWAFNKTLFITDNLKGESRYTFMTSKEFLKIIKLVDK